MAETCINKICRSCGYESTAKYCANCGQSYTIKKITVKNLLHDVFHFFTHLEKGFGYTLKQLMVAPGTMQRNYIDGDRSKHQKPFSMFFICATFSAIARYWILYALIKYYNTGESSEANFFHEYSTILVVVMVPVNVFVTWLFFYRSRFNYAETGVLLLYTQSVFLLFSVFTFLLKFIWPDLDTAYIELPVLILYNAITLVKFYNDESRWMVILKSIVTLCILFALMQTMENLLIKGHI